MCKNEGDALGFRMASRWGLGHCPAGELGKGAVGVAGLESNGETPWTNHAFPAPTGRHVKAQGIALVLTHILIKSGEVTNF